MRWKPKQRPAEDPEPSKARNRKWFALWPTLVEDIDGYDVMIWLEWYTAYQELGQDGYGHPRWRTLTRFTHA